MVQALQPQTLSPPNPQANPSLLDPNLLRVARHLYYAYAEVHAQRMSRPLGVAINPNNYRGLLLFSRKPVLLPGECFIPFERIEGEVF